MEGHRPLLRTAFFALAFLSAGFHTLGAFWYDSRWDAMIETDRYPDRLWNWTSSPLVYYGTQSFNSVRRGFAHLEIRLLHLPTSLNSPELLAASYSLSRLPAETIVQPYPCGLLNISVKAINTGKAVWLARGKQDRGAVRLGWRWFWMGKEVPAMSGRETLQYDVFPGQHYEFTARIAPPAWPQEYSLQVGLVSEPERWFSELGIEPFKATVQVVNLTSADVEGHLAKKFKTISDPPQLAITTDRPRYQQGGILRVSVDLINADRAHTVDGYAVLAWPNGQVSFLDSTGSLIESGDSWVPLNKGVELHKGVQFFAHPLFDLKLIHMPSGCFSWYVILTESNTYDIIALAQAFFRVD
jgi:hypothetical protein